MMDQEGMVDETVAQYVTFAIEGGLFGLPVARVNDVFRPQAVTRVPLALPAIAGILNLRGRIVTMIDMDVRLGRGARAEPKMAVTVDLHGESYGLLVDQVRDVVALREQEMQPVPANLDLRLAGLASGIFWLDQGALVILDIDRVLDLENEAIAA